MFNKTASPHNRWRCLLASPLVAAKLLCLCLAYTTALAQVTASKALTLSGDYWGTHDPSIAKDGGTYYVFTTGAARPNPATASSLPSVLRPQIAVRCSKDLLEWRFCGAVFPALPQWIRDISPSTKDLWAPDISYFDRLFHLYYSYSVFGRNTSGIGLATNVTLDPSSPRYKWDDKGLVLRSGSGDDFNAIDPNLTIDQDGNAWLAFGSFWTGIKMRRLDRLTGLPSTSDGNFYALASRGFVRKPQPSEALPPDEEAIEAPFIYWHDGYYYLFVSWDLCCRGTKSTYRTMVGRSRQITGPYVDRAGKSMLEGGGSPVLSSNEVWIGPGGASLLRLAAADLIAFHAYSAADGRPALQLSTLFWQDGWPSAAFPAIH